MTNLMEIAIFTPPRKQCPEYTFERVETTQFTLALRVISTASLYDFLPGTGFLHLPYPDLGIVEAIREGPPQNPDRPLSSDKEIFDSCKRLADFDLVSLFHYPPWAYQFFRWCKHVRENKAPVAQSGDVLTAATNNTGTLFPDDARPLFPFDLSELPMDTRTHLQTIQRESPLATTDIGERFEKSRNFTIRILETISEHSVKGMGSVFLCQITSIDGQSVSSPTLCLKLFDDRFPHLRIPEEGSLYYRDFFACLQDAPSLALNEAQVYDKLRPVQGSIIPWFYGIHQFTLPDGLTLPGLLLEYIRGSGLHSDYVRTASAERQIQMIQSCRHGCRVLDIGDIAQRDWHDGQVLFYTVPETQLEHAVFIDFALVVQTWELEDIFLLRNYQDLFYLLRDSTGIDSKLVAEHFGPPDDWDASVVCTSDGEEIQARDMFPYISRHSIPGWFL